MLLRCGDPSLDYTESFWNLIVTNVAIAHVTIAHEDELVTCYCSGVGIQALTTLRITFLKFNSY